MYKSKKILINRYTIAIVISGIHSFTDHTTKIAIKAEAVATKK